MSAGGDSVGLLDSASYPHLAKARTLSNERIDRARAELSSSAGDGLDVVGFGSLARREMTEESDFDFLVLALQLTRDPDAPVNLLRRADDLRRAWLVDEGHTDELGQTDKKVNPPGKSGVFGRAVGAFDLVDKIGLQDDTNHSMTRRMLLLEESVSLMDPAVHSAVVRAALRRYLEVGHTDPNKVPRFLLNDVVRYWRTLSIDYQAKVREDSAPSGLRYLKLIIPRKTLFAGTLMPLLLCGLDGWHQADAEDLARQFALTPLERLVQGYSVAPPNVQDAMTGALGVVDHFLERSADEDWRKQVKEGRPGGTEQAAFDEMRAHADVLEDHLETIFFDWDAIRSRSRRTLVF